MKEKILRLLEYNLPAGVVDAAIRENPFFTADDISYAWDALRLWKPDIQAFPHLPHKSTKVGIIAAGNIPFAGMHDLVCVCLNGSIPLFRPSSRDGILMGWVTQQLDLQFVSEFGMQEADAIIASGSSTTARQIESAFPDIPGLIRGHRFSIAILPSDAGREELRLLSADILRYNGFGCRSISNVVTPSTEATRDLLDTLKSVTWEVSKAYRKVLDWERAILKVNHQEADPGLPVIPIYSESVRSVAPGYLNIVHGSPAFHPSEIQVIAGRGGNVPFGETQRPGFYDFADGRNVFEWLDRLFQDNN